MINSDGVNDHRHGGEVLWCAVVWENTERRRKREKAKRAKAEKTQKAKVAKEMLERQRKRNRY